MFQRPVFAQHSFYFLNLFLLLQNLDFVRHPTAQRGEELFYQSANYRAVLFAAIIADVLLKQALSLASFL